MKIYMTFILFSLLYSFKAFGIECGILLEKDANIQSQITQKKIKGPLFTTGFDKVKIEQRLSRIEAEKIINSFPEESLRISVDEEKQKKGESANAILKLDSRFNAISELIDKMTADFIKLLPPGYSLRPKMIQIILQKAGARSWMPRFHIEEGEDLSSFFTAYGNRTTRYVRSEFIQQTTGPLPNQYEGSLVNRNAPTSWLQNSIDPKFIFPKWKIEHAEPDQALLFFSENTAKIFPSEWVSKANPLMHASPDFTTEALDDYRVAFGVDYTLIKN